ncbi:hypothetical protein ACHAXT_003914 [Thalassiosira profunda]
MPPLLQQLRRHTHLGNPAAERKKGGLFAIPERKGGDHLERSRSEVVARQNPFLEEEAEEGDDSQPPAQGVEFMDLKGPAAPFATARDEYQVMVEEYEEEIQRLEKVNATLTANVVTLTAAAMDSDADGTSSMGQVSVITVERCKSCGNESCSEAEEGSVRSNVERRASIGGMEITPNEMYSPLNNDIYNDMILTEEHYLHQISKLQKNNAKLQKRLDGKKKLVSQLSMNLKTAAEKITEVGKENATLKTKVKKGNKVGQSQPPEDQAAIAEQEQIHQFQVQVLENELKGLINLVGERAKVHEEHRRALLEDYRRDDAAWKRKMEKPEDTMARVVRRLRKGDVVDDWHVNTDAASPVVESRNEGAAAKPGFSVLDSVTSLFGGSERQQPQPQLQMKGSLLPEERVRIDEHPTAEENKGFDESSSESEESDESSSSGSSSNNSSTGSEEEDSVDSAGRLEPVAPSGGFDNSADAGNAEFEAMKHHVFGRKDTETGTFAPPSVPPPDLDEPNSDEDESSSSDESRSSSESSSDGESEVDSPDASPVAPREELLDETNPSHVGDVVVDARDFDTPVTVDSELQVPKEPHQDEEGRNDTHTANEAAQAEDHPENDTPEGDNETVVNSVPEPNGPVAVVESTETTGADAVEATAATDAIESDDSGPAAVVESTEAKATAAAEAIGNGNSDVEHAVEGHHDDGDMVDGYTAQEAKDEENSVVHELERADEDSDDEYDPKEGKDVDESDHDDDEEEQDAAATVLQSDEPRLQEEEAEEADNRATAQAETAEAHLDTNPAPEQNEGGLPDVERSEPSTDKRVAVPSKDGTFSDEPSASRGAPQEEKSESPSTELHSAKSHPETIATSVAAISDASQVRVSAALELRYNAANKTLADTLAMIQEQNKARMEGIDDDRSANQYHNVLSHFSKPEGAKPKKDALTNRMSRRQLFQNTALTPADLSVDNLNKTEDRQVLVTSRDIDKYQVPRYQPPLLPPDTKSSSAPTFKKGLKDGYYVYRSSSGNTYAGQWKSGKRHGHGRAKYRDGEVYDGEWRGGRRHGHGVLHLANSEVFEGSWSANKKHGLGVYYWADGEVDVSLYEHDVRLESLRWTKDRRRAYLLTLSTAKKEQISLVRAARVVKGWEQKDVTLD